MVASRAATTCVVASCCTWYSELCHAAGVEPTAAYTQSKAPPFWTQVAVWHCIGPVQGVWVQSPWLAAKSGDVVAICLVAVQLSVRKHIITPPALKPGTTHPHKRLTHRAADNEVHAPLPRQHCLHHHGQALSRWTLIRHLATLLHTDLGLLSSNTSSSTCSLRGRGCHQARAVCSQPANSPGPEAGGCGHFIKHN